jgi:hypothetical protein
VKVARYTADYKGTEWVTAFVPAVQGTAIIGKQSKWEIDPFYVEVKLTPQDAEAPIEATAGCDGDIYFLIDAKTKTVYEDMDQAVLGSQSRNIQRVLMREFASPKPFEDALKAGTIQLRETEQVGGEACHVVFVEGEQPPTLLYYIAAKDYLPRKIVRTYKNDEGAEGTTELAIHDLAINPSFVKSPFKVVIPAGFTKTDEFAP